ncbi:unnamed protein product [Plutella xylostella]|uniref:(diamondback moth) hypothetical protein n=1 Tax=Plutella xylostella TaxID=51655 RepID=A0A8S4E7F0_PLUXY|nr:unnamed protein product [Plutella xylostella]
MLRFFGGECTRRISTQNEYKRQSGHRDGRELRNRRLYRRRVSKTRRQSGDGRQKRGEAQQSVLRLRQRPARKCSPRDQRRTFRRTKTSRRIIDTTVQQFGQIDVLINNAGFNKLVTIHDEKAMDAFDAVLATNLRGVVHLTHLAIPYLKKTKGNIVNVSSVAACEAHGTNLLGATARQRQLWTTSPSAWLGSWLPM